jgi:DNA-directed RNA polymerase specialized sigma24 family protein
MAAGVFDEHALHQYSDPGPNPEALVMEGQRRRHLASVVRALPARDRRCLFMRAAGFTYRDIAAATGVSLGAVAKSLARATTRLVNAEKAREEV